LQELVVNYVPVVVILFRHGSLIMLQTFFTVWSIFNLLKFT
jgi:hypothetical protein